MDSKTVTLSIKAQKRITSDIHELSKNQEDLNNNGIYWHIDEDNIREILVVITGQEGTPYADAPFFFKFTYPELYPLKPPEGLFCTSDGQTRFNPNLYINGKICLSILGTWSGPCWTPVMTIKTVIMSIIGLVMTNEPLRNEPGWENAPKNEIADYNNVVEYRSLKVGIIDQLTNCQECFRPMYEKMVDRFKRDYIKIIQRIDANAERLKGVDTIRPRYGSHSKIDYVSLKSEMIDLGKRLGVQETIPIPFPTEISQKTEEKIITPKMSASLFDIGLEVTFEGNIYTVKEYKNGKKYWKKNSESQ